MEIKAAVMHEINKIEIESAELSAPREGEVLVKILSSGICRSDLAVLGGIVPSPLPAILGHEGAGIVEKVGPGVTTHKPGDKVIVCLPSCGTCPECLDGHSFICENQNDFIFKGVYRDGTFRASQNGVECSSMYMQGSFADHVIAAANCAIVVDVDEDSLRNLSSLGCGAMTGAGSVINGLSPEKGSSIAVFGCGGVGMAAIMAAKICGCDPIIAVDVFDDKLEFVKQFGATHTVNSKNVDAPEAIREITGGHGANYSLECTGVPVVILNAINCLSTLGTCCLISVTGDAEVPIALEPMLMNKSRTLKGLAKGGCDPREFIPKMVEHYKAGEFPIDKLAKHYKFDQIHEAIDDLKNGKVIKPILDIG